MTDVGKVVAARFISRAGAFAAFFVGIWGKAAFEFDAGAGETAGLIAVAGVSAMVGTVISGVLVDRFDPRRVMLWAEVAFVPATLALIAARSMAELIGLVALSGLVTAPILTASGAFTPYLTDDEDEIKRINSWMEMAAMGALTAGTALGAIVETIGSVDWVFVFDAATSLVAVALIAGVRVEPQAEEERSSMWAEARRGLGFTYRQRPLRYYVLMGLAVYVVFGAFGALEPLFFRDVVGAKDASVLGWVNAVFGIGLFAGAVASARAPDWLTSARGLGGIVAANGLGVALYVGTGTLVGAYVGAVVWGFLIGLMAPILRSLVHLASPRGMVGRVSSVLELHHAGGELMPLVFVAALAAVFGVRETLLGFGGMLAIVGAASLMEAAAVDRMVDTSDTDVRATDAALDPYPPH